MKCNCSLNNNYEIIGLCDIKNFNQHISKFTDRSWTQINIPEKLVIPNNKPSIKNITKVYLDIKINSTKIIQTPSSDQPNTEGLNLTGKILLVSGQICQKVIYISETIYDSLHSATFNVSFSTYIVIEQDIDLENDSFCVYPCVEDLSAYLLNERTIAKNTTLFLFAHKINRPIPPPPPIEKFQTSFIFKTLANDEDMAKIEFNKTDMKLIVSSTEKSYGSQGDNNAFEFKLLDSTGNIKISSEIKENTNADDFKNQLNDQDFDIGDTLELTYLNPSKVVLSDYPDMGDTYTMNTGAPTEKFIITPNGITPILLPNKITVKSKNDEVVLTIEFTKDSNKFIVSSKGIIPDPSSTDVYLKLILKNSRGITDLLTAILNSNGDGSNLKTNLNNQEFDFSNNRLVLIYKDKSKIEISNYPSSGDMYTPNIDVDIFEITRTGLIDKSFNQMIRILSDNNEDVVTLNFINTNSFPSIVPRSTGVVGTNNLSNTTPYVELLHYQGSGYNIFSQILGKENASQFVSKLYNKILTTEFPVRLFNKIPNRVIITNYKGQIEYRIGEEPEFFKATPTQLIPYDLNYNKIKLKNRDNLTILWIYFDRIDGSQIYVEPYSTGKTNTDSDSFSFMVKDSTETRVKVQGSINKGQTADSIKIFDPTNILSVNVGDILILNYSNKPLVEIFNFPFTSRPYNPDGTTSQKFNMTRNGLVPINLLDKVVITFKGFNNAEIATLKFDVNQKKLLATSTGTLAHPSTFLDVEYFAAILTDATGNIKAQSSVLGRENANIFRNTLNNTNFNFGDSLTIRYKERTRVEISNYPNQGQTFNPPKNTETFVITQNELKALEYSTNSIYIENTQNQNFGEIKLNIISNIFFVENGGIIANPTGGTSEYFKLTLKNSSGVEKYSASVNEDQDAIPLINGLNTKMFEDRDKITLKYKDRNRVFILNYPNQGEKYTPLKDTEDFIIFQNKIFPVLAPKPVEKLKNTFILNAFDPNAEMAKIEFDKTNLKLIVTSNGRSYGLVSGLAFKCDLLTSDGVTLKATSTILQNQNANSFKNNLTGRPFEFGDIIRMQYHTEFRIKLSNYPNMGDEYRPTNNSQDFTITQNGIVPK